MKELNLVYKGGKFNLEYLNFNIFFYFFSNIISGALFFMAHYIFIFFYNLKPALPLKSPPTPNP